MRLHELIDTSKRGHGQDPAKDGFIVAGSSGDVKDLIVFRGGKQDAQEFLVNPNNAYRISKKYPKVYQSRYLEVGDKFDPKKLVQFDKWEDVKHMTMKGG